MDEREVMDELSGTDSPTDWAKGFAQFVADRGEAMTIDDVINWFDEAMTAAKAFQWREDARELVGVQEMLAHVLIAVGDPVVVTKDQLKGVSLENRTIAVEDDVTTGDFTFYVGEVQND